MMLGDNLTMYADSSPTTFHCIIALFNKQTNKQKTLVCFQSTLVIEAEHTPSRTWFRSSGGVSGTAKNKFMFVQVLLVDIGTWNVANDIIVNDALEINYRAPAAHYHHRHHQKHKNTPCVWTLIRHCFDPQTLLIVCKSRIAPTHFIMIKWVHCTHQHSNRRHGL